MSSLSLFGRLLRLCLVLLFGTQALALNLPLHWHWSNPAPHGNNIVDMIETNGVLVQVCDRGQIYSSVDLEKWVSRESHTTRALRSICFFKGQFVVSGEGGTIVTGNNALEFQTNSLGTTDWLEGIAASPSLAVAVGDNGAIYKSADAMAWERQSVSFTTWLRSVAFGTPGSQGTFVVVGEKGFIATSNDAKDWTTNSPPTGENLNHVAWVNRQFWVVGDAGTAFVSDNGKQWSAVGRTGAINALNAVAGTTGSVLIAGDREVRLQEGRNAWLDQLSIGGFPAPAWNYLTALHDGISYLLGGRTGVLVEGFKTNAASETFWLPFSTSVRNWLWDVKHFPSAYIAVGDATVMTSLDGIDWAQEFVPDSVANTAFLGVGGRTNLAVAVGSGGTIMLSQDTFVPVVSTNLDGTLVTNQVSILGLIWNPVQPSPTANDLQGVATFGDKLVVTGGAGTVLTSTDGTNWQQRVTSTASFLSSVDAGPSGLVAVGKNGVILASSDAISWSERISNTTNWIYRVRRFSDRWIAVGQNGTILASPDGTNWSSQPSGTTSWLNDVIFVGDSYFVIGNQGTVLASSDGVKWTNLGTITGKSLYGAASHNDRLVAVGIEGVILRSHITPLTSPVIFIKYPTNATQNLFLFGGEPDQRFTLDRSTNLSNWLSGAILDISDSSGTLIHEDTGTNAPLLQFFRARVVP